MTTHNKTHSFIVRFIVFVMIVTLAETAHAMHIMEGFLPPVNCVAWGILCVPFLVLGVMKINRIATCNRQMVVFLAMAGAFTFVLSALKIPSVTGSSSHMTGLGFAAILFGPFVACVLAVIVLLFQTILLAHGGLSTLGANVFSMGIVGPIVAFAIYVSLSRARAPHSMSVFCAAALGDLATYVTTALQLANAWPSETGGVMASFLKFAGIFAVTQIPLAVIEGILTVVLVNVITAYSGEMIPALNGKELARD